MTLMRETPNDHGLLLDHVPKGNRRLSVTLAGKSPSRNGRQLQYATGTLYQRCFQHASAILWNHHGQRPQPQEENGRQYHTITEQAAVQTQPLLDALSGTERADKAERLARGLSRPTSVRKQLVVRLPQEPEPAKQGTNALALMYG